jgi:hypothetical protein
MKTAHLFLVVVCILAFSSVAFSQEPNEGDIQFWNETKVYFPSITKTDKDGKKKKIITPFIMGTLRVGQDVQHFVSERIGFGFDIPINKYFKFTPSYYYVAEQPIKNVKSYENRHRFEVTGEKKWKKFSISDRNRVEYRIRNSRRDSVRYRNKFKLKVPIKKDGKELFAAFVADEPFYSFTVKLWTRNEFSTGIERKFGKDTSAEFFYMHQYNNAPILKNVNIVGINLKFTID